MTTVDSRDIPLEDYLLDDRSSYVKLPTVSLPEGSEVLVGDEAWRTAMDVASTATGHPLLAVDVYPGADVAAIASRIREVLPEADVIDVEDAAAADLTAIEALITRNLTDDRVFGVMSHFTVDEFYDAERLARPAASASTSAPARPCSSAGAPTWPPAAAPTRSSSSTSPAGRSSSASAPALRTGAPATATRTSCASTSAASSSSGASPTGTSAHLFDRIDLARSTATPRRRAPAPTAARTSAPALARRDRRAVPRRPLLRPRRLGRPVDEEHVCDLDPTTTTTAGASTACPRRTRCCSTSAGASSSSPRSTSCSATRASCSASGRTPASATSSRSASTSSTRWAAATSRCRCTR